MMTACEPRILVLLLCDRLLAKASARVSKLPSAGPDRCTAAVEICAVLCAGTAHQLSRLAGWISCGGLQQADPALLQLALPICLQQLRCALRRRHSGEALQQHFGQVLLHWLHLDTRSASAANAHLCPRLATAPAVPAAPSSFSCKLNYVDEKRTAVNT